MKKILFVYDMDQNQVKNWEDGLWAAMKLLKQDFDISALNLQQYNFAYQNTVDFVLGWGGFDSAVDKALQQVTNKPKGLCLSAQFPANETAKNYDVIFYETESVRRWLETENLPNLVHAFGVNTDIYDKQDYTKLWDNIAVGSFTKWHRFDKLYDLSGNNLVVGSIQTGNIQESFNDVANLVIRGWTVMDQVPPKRLAILYNMSKKCILTADFGQERACLEARACGLEVEVPDNNPKLKELKESTIWDHNYYYNQLKKGITDVIGA